MKKVNKEFCTGEEENEQEAGDSHWQESYPTGRFSQKIVLAAFLTEPEALIEGVR